MTPEEIIEMAREAWADSGEGWVVNRWFEDRAKAFEAFAKLVAAKEREACAKTLESISNAPDIKAYAAAIRARGET